MASLLCTGGQGVGPERPLCIRAFLEVRDCGHIHIHLLLFSGLMDDRRKFVKEDPPPERHHFGQGMAAR